MRITAAELVRIRIPFSGSFGHASHTRRAADAWIVRLRAGEVVGYGEIQPRPYVTGEALEDVPALFAPWRERLVGLELDGPDAVRDWALGAADDAGPALATLCGVELAALDVFGRGLGFSAAELLGAEAFPLPPAGYVIGFEVPTEKLRAHCMALKFKRRTHVKVKVGHDEDRARLETVRRVFGDGWPMRIDANMAWTAQEAVARLTEWRDLAIASVEQPVAKADVAGLARIRAEAGVPVMADESLCSLADAEALLAADAVDIFNVRVGKCGGLFATRRLVDLARREGRGLHLGTMVGETGVLGAASEILATRTGAFDYVEGLRQNHYLLSDDVLVESEPSETLGLGIDVAEGQLRKYGVDP